MKKVLLTGAALMLAGGMVSTASAAAVEPGIKITGDARVRIFYQSDDYQDFGNAINTAGWADAARFPGSTAYNNRNNTDDANTDMDSRIRINIAGTAAGGAYAKARIRITDSSLMGDLDNDATAINTSVDHDNIWADVAYIGIPFNDMFTLELGRWRSTYGPLPTTYNFFYDDVNLSGIRGIVKIGEIEINPFIEWMEEAQNAADSAATSIDKNEDNDEIRFGVHAKGKINKDWTVGGMLGYQTDARQESTVNDILHTGFEANEGFFGSVYTNGKAGAFGLVAEFAVTDAKLNNFNSWELDESTGLGYTDLIGSADTGFGGYVFPNYQIDKLNLGLNLGFTINGFQPDRAFGFVMLGSSDNSKITAGRIGDTGDWMWAGLVATYQIDEALKLTGNLVYADVDPWDTTGANGDGPITSSGAYFLALDNAWELSAVLQYTISKGMDVYFSAGYLKPEFEASNVQDDGAFGALTRFELKF